MNRSELNLLTNKINKRFADIGTTNGTAMPQSPSNNEHIAYELHIALALARLAEGRKKHAMKEAVKAGIIFDHEKEPKPAGTKETLFNGSVVQVDVSVKTPTSRFDHNKFIDDLLATFITLPREEVEALVFKHTYLNRPAHTFTTELVSD